MKLHVAGDGRVLDVGGTEQQVELSLLYDCRVAGVDGFQDVPHPRKQRPAMEACEELRQTDYGEQSARTIILDRNARLVIDGSIRGRGTCDSTIRSPTHHISSSFVLFT